MNTKQFEVIGDLAAPNDVKDVTSIFRKYAKNGVKDDEHIFLNWRVVSTETGRTMAVFGGGAGYDAACVFKDYCEANYRA